MHDDNFEKSKIIAEHFCTCNFFICINNVQPLPVISLNVRDVGFVKNMPFEFGQGLINIVIQ